MFYQSHPHLFTAVLFTAITTLSSNASAQVTAERVLPNRIFIPGFAMIVQITITGEPGPLHVVENPPAGWAVKSIIREGKLDQGVITWENDSFSGSLMLRYQAIPPADAKEGVVFSGSVNGQDISGMKEMQAFQADLSKDYRLLPVTGPHSVGTEICHWIDPLREETYSSNDPNDKRELMVQIWYPTDAPGDTPPIACFPALEILKPYYVARYTLLPEIYFTLLSHLTANAVPNAPLSNASPEYPILLYSPGLTATRNFQNYLMEDLASHGYIVIGIDHTYNAVAVRFPDGHIVKGIGGSVNLHTQDVKFVVDQIERLDQNSVHSQFAGRLDEKRIGIMGMSLGGDVVTSAMRTDSRIRAGISYDGGGGLSGINQALLFMGPNPPSTTLPGGGCGCKIANTLHQDYVELPWYWKLLGLPGIYPRDSRAEHPERVCRIINDYSIAFFDKVLKGKTVPLLDGPSPEYPEVTFLSYGEPNVVGIENWDQY